MKILWDFHIRTDRVIETRCPVIVLIDNKNQETLIIDVAIPGDFRIRDKEAEKIIKIPRFCIENMSNAEYKS